MYFYVSHLKHLFIVLVAGEHLTKAINLHYIVKFELYTVKSKDHKSKVNQHNENIADNYSGLYDFPQRLKSKKQTNKKMSSRCEVICHFLKSHDRKLAYLFIHKKCKGKKL